CNHHDRSDGRYLVSIACRRVVHLPWLHGICSPSSRRASSTVGRSAGVSEKQARTSEASGECVASSGSQSGGADGDLSWLIRVNGRRPVIARYRTPPKPQTSVAGVNSAPVICSGALYSKAPAVTALVPIGRARFRS